MSPLLCNHFTGDDAQWNRMVLSGLRPTVFQLSQWGRYWRENSDCKVMRLIISRPEGGMCALALVAVDVHTGLASWIDGPVLLEENTNPGFQLQVLDSLLSRLRAEGLRGAGTGDPARLSTAFDSSELVQGLAAIGCRLQKWATFVVDLKGKSLDDIWNGFHRSVRKNVRKCGQEGVRVDRISSVEDLEHLYLPLLTQYRQAMGLNLPPCYPEEKLWQCLRDEQTHVEAFVATREGEVLSCLGVIGGAGRVVEIAVARSDLTRQLKLNPQDLIKWEIIRWAHAQGIAEYDLGGVNPDPVTEKERGIYLFKQKFGGRIEDFFLLSCEFLQPPTKPRGLGRLRHLIHQALFRPKGTGEVENVTQLRRQAQDRYSDPAIYPTESICVLPQPGKRAYLEQTLALKLDWARGLCQKRRILDLGCGSGAHLLHLAPEAEFAIGLDFVQSHLEKANQDRDAQGQQRASFVRGDAYQLPFRQNSLDMVFSFSVLYGVPEVEQTLAEVFRVLRPGGVCLLDMGNRYSLNTLLSRHAGNTVDLHVYSLPATTRLLRQTGYVILQHRSFQMLPLWKPPRSPWWLFWALWPFWSRLANVNLGGEMLDERVSSLPGLRNFAFRHIFVCQKPMKD